MKKHAPATLRNRDAILSVLREELPVTGRVLEIAAGSGEHAVFFARWLAPRKWVPTDPSPDALASIAAYAREAKLPNLEAPLELDASVPDWPVAKADAIVCINMVHISPWTATQGLFAGAAQILSNSRSPLILYGPYFESGIPPAVSNLQFDAGLKERNPNWGIRNVDDVDAVASDHGFARRSRHTMPANNLTLVYRRM